MPPPPPDPLGMTMPLNKSFDDFIQRVKAKNTWKSKEKRNNNTIYTLYMKQYVWLGYEFIIFKY